MTGRDHPTQRAAHWGRWRLDRHDQAGTVLGNPDHVQAGQPDEQVAAITVGSATRAALTRPVGSIIVRVLVERVLGRS
jgi:hypothetical protein